ncbi:hypothetical protein ACP70R_049588 [Stipagrostis hirtigluma subsp. patula]
MKKYGNENGGAAGTSMMAPNSFADNIDLGSQGGSGSSDRLELTLFPKSGDLSGLGMMAPTSIADNLDLGYKVGGGCSDGLELTLFPRSGDHKVTDMMAPTSFAHNDNLDLGSRGGGGGGGRSNIGDEPARTLKRPRLVWTPQLHKRFVDAVAHLGIKNAVPKTILQLMSVDGLTRENVASHLTKYRLYLKRMQGLGGGGAAAAGGSHSSGSGMDAATEHSFARGQ